MSIFNRYAGPAALAAFLAPALLASCLSVTARHPAPPSPEFIMGQGKVSAKGLSRFLAESNPAADRAFAARLSEYYVNEAAAEGVNHDVAFAQMCLETGFLNYGGLVSPDMNNFCGLGSTGPGHPGEVFPEPRIGVRAHIQHLKAYATTAPLNQELVDPRYRWVRYGSSPAVQGLAGTWAADRAYGDKLRAMLERLYRSAFG
ncbi:MAG: glucosaminidase domain-containing protein [Treponema sp.]|jgi:hypothetical protein|nr:glucosaminidase domain-containing protein [Treponema sp.]